MAEHHDGFQMYSSDLSRYNAAQMGPKRDILGELKTAFEKKGLVFGASSHRAEHHWFMGPGRDFESGPRCHDRDHGRSLLRFVSDIAFCL